MARRSPATSVPGTARPPALNALQEGRTRVTRAPSQTERRPGATRFVGSAAVENDFPIPSERKTTRVEVLGTQAHRSGDDLGSASKLEAWRRSTIRMSSPVSSIWWSASGVIRAMRKRRRKRWRVTTFHTRYAPSPREDRQQPEARRRHEPGQPFQLFAEKQAHDDEGADPQECAQAVEEEEAPEWHPDDPRERGCYLAQAGNELGDDQGGTSAAGEQGLRVADARIRFKGNPAEKLQNAGAAPTSERVPHDVTHESADHAHPKDEGEMHLAGPRQGAGRQQDWLRRGG